ncbi:hypothetical protein AB0L33_23580 [Streptomyces sp. NPDC052299]|uniref:hypothetical protein n=1 Tax=Streptomyces sp. NPDC052299 TaxID=3155054 RepID=UPI00344113B6
MSTNGNAPRQPGDPVININLSGNAQLNWAYGDQMPSIRSDSESGSSDRRPFWKNVIFWTAVGAIATTVGAITAFL